MASWFFFTIYLLLGIMILSSTSSVSSKCYNTIDFYDFYLTTNMKDITVACPPVLRWAMNQTDKR